MNLIDFIEKSFTNRNQPDFVVNDPHPNTNEYIEAMHFQGKPWKSTDLEDWEKYSDAIYGFSPEAFCYYLPGIFCVGIKEECPNLLVNYSLLGMLDRSPDPTCWDNFFVERWVMLTEKECEAAQQWILWLSCFEPPSDTRCTKAYETLELLKQRRP
jgi:hypothetical protein